MTEREWLVQSIKLLHQIATKKGPERLSVRNLKMLRDITKGMNEFAESKIEVRTKIRKLRANGYEAFEIDEKFGYGE